MVDKSLMDRQHRKMEMHMKMISKVAATACVAALVAGSATAGGVSPTGVEDDVYVAETAPAGALGGAAPLLLLGAVALAVAAGGGGGSNGTSGTN